MESSKAAARPRRQQELLDSAYSCCVACDGEDLRGRGNPMRGRTKSRSLSASPALGNSEDFRRTRSLHGPSPVTKFGPKACMLQNPKAIMHIQDPASQQLTWNKPPKSVLVIKKIRDASLLQPFKELCIFLTESKNMIVYVERKVLEDPEISNDESFGAVIKKFCTFREDYDNISDRVDFIICLGGDGTLLYASSLFQESVPPVMAFHLGSLGFLTPFSFDTYQSQVTQVIEGSAAIILRSRLKVKVLKEPREKTSVQERGKEKGLIIKNGESEISRRTVQYQVLNEVVVDRGPSSYLSNVDLFLDGHLITTVQGDGVIVSTPTGSTAYAVAAGASMIHPNVPAILITPICPHSLSFRPIVVPAGVELKIMLCPDARNTAWVSFDGRKRQEICHGDSITITTSCYPVPSICFRDPVNDWFESLAECLHWNVRKKQNPFIVEEEEY
ncbi:NAD kinase-like isoform X1 [Polyodon spathula]|uniref:NAD kinase-like isoform X1 n=1 Tax=Polyodon spathula TaxID=7913 RepID=UPI001B7E47DE|nr:NAD kinase-like isoform X1 [Polyodon spathula]